MRARAAALIVCLMAALGVAVIDAPPADAATGNAASVFALTNTQRTDAGLRPLISNMALDAAAQAWAQQLADSCTFSHSSGAWRSARTSAVGWSQTGENIAAGQSSATAVVTAWMNSAGHRANILDSRYTGLGVGFATGSCYTTYWVQIFGVGAVPATAGAGDVNGDFAPDVLALASDGRLLSYRGSGGTALRGPFVAVSPWSTRDAVVTLGDFSGDGIADLGRVGPDGRFLLLRGTGAGGYESAVTIGNGWQVFNRIVGGIDYTGDGRTDVLARKPDGSLWLYPGNGKSGWQSGVRVVGNGWGTMTAIFYAGDFNGDGRGDIISRRSDGTLWLYPTTGAGGWLAARQIGNGWGGMTALFSPGDFDSSGSDDVIARTADGRLLLYRGNGVGGWGAVSVIGNGWNGLTQIV